MILFCDIMLLGFLLTYLVWFIRNAKTRFPDQSLEDVDDCLKNALYLRKDWLKGALLFKGYYKLSQWCSILFPMYILFIMSYSNDDEVERIAIYTCLSLISSIVNVTLGFDKVAKCFREAYCLINSAISQYNISKTDSILFEAIDKGEEILKRIDDF